MSKKRYGPELIISKLREVEVMLSKGATVGEASKKIRVGHAAARGVVQGAVAWLSRGSAPDILRPRRDVGGPARR